MPYNQAMEDPFPSRKFLPHDVPNWVPEGAVHFVTVNALPRAAAPLMRDGLPQKLIASIRWRQEQRQWWVHLALIMPDHVHMLITFAREVKLQESVTSWKRWAARELGINWQRDFFEHRIRDDALYQEKAHYIRMNPVRKGLVAAPGDWPHVWSENR